MRREKSDVHNDNIIIALCLSSHRGSKERGGLRGSQMAQDLSVRRGEGGGWWWTASRRELDIFSERTENTDHEPTTGYEATTESCLGWEDMETGRNGMARLIGARTKSSVELSEGTSSKVQHNENSDHERCALQCVLPSQLLPCAGEWQRSAVSLVSS